MTNSGDLYQPPVIRFNPFNPFHWTPAVALLALVEAIVIGGFLYEAILLVTLG